MPQKLAPNMNIQEPRQPIAEPGVSHAGTRSIPSAQGKYEDADALYQQAIEMEENTLGPDHPNLAASLTNWANMLREQVIHVQIRGRVYLHAIVPCLPTCCEMRAIIVLGVRCIKPHLLFGPERRDVYGAVNSIEDWELRLN